MQARSALGRPFVTGPQPGRWPLWEQEQAILAEIRARTAEDRRVLKDKPLTERMICAGTLRALGVDFSVPELVNVDREGMPSDVDVAFGDAAFQVTEPLGGRKRDGELPSYQQLVKEAGTLDEVMDATRFEADVDKGMPLFPRRISHEQLVEIVTAALATKATRYGSRGCSGLDAVVYVDQRIVLDCGSPQASAGSQEKVRAQAWRSVTVFVWPLA